MRSGCGEELAIVFFAGVVALSGGDRCQEPSFSAGEEGRTHTRFVSELFVDVVGQCWGPVWFPGRPIPCVLSCIAIGPFFLRVKVWGFEVIAGKWSKPTQVLTGSDRGPRSPPTTQRTVAVTARLGWACACITTDPMNREHFLRCPWHHVSRL